MHPIPGVHGVHALIDAVELHAASLRRLNAASVVLFPGFGGLVDTTCSFFLLWNAWMPQDSHMNYYVYALRCRDGSIYIGFTTDMERRLAMHQEGYYKDSYTYSRRPVEFLRCWTFPSADQALAAERMMKKWRRAKKLAFIADDQEAFARESMSTSQKRRLARKRTPVPP